MVNKRRFNALIKRIEKSKSFDMRACTWGEHDLPANGHPCGTAACIAGHLDQMMKKNGVTGDGAMNGRADYLGVLERFRLHQVVFTPNTSKVDFHAPPGAPGHITKKMAIKALERVRDGCELDEDVVWRK